MRQIMIVAGAFMLGGIATGAVLSQAQPPAPQPPVQLVDAGPQGDPPRPMMGWGHHWMHHGWRGMHAGGPTQGMRAFALIYRQQDRALSPADVQKIAEAFLLWNGNHSWKVANVVPAADGLVAFDLTAQDGSAIAKFTMDPHTAKIVRVG